MKNVTYILKCNDNSLYTGWTNDITHRLKMHNEGKGAKYTRGRGPVELVYLEEFETKQEAMSREAKIKRLTRKEKLLLIETKRTGDMINSRKLFDDSEKAHTITEDEMIKIEKINGILLLIGAEDDVLWDTAKNIRRMKQRMKEHPHTCRLEYVIYEHGTHFVFPESMLKTMLPVGSGVFMKLAFQAARKYPKECQRARLDIDKRVRNAVEEWKQSQL